MELVKFKDTTYGIRRWSWFSYHYYCGRYWWYSQECIKQYCHLPKEYAERLFEKLNTKFDKGEPV